MNVTFTKTFLKGAAAAAILLLSVSGAYAQVDRMGEPSDGTNSAPGENAVTIDVPSGEVARRAAEFEELYAAADNDTKLLISQAFADKVKERIELYVKPHHWKEDSWARGELEKLQSAIDYKTKLMAYRAKTEAVCPADACLEALKEFEESMDSNELRFYGDELVAYALRCDLYEGMKPGAK